ncbi:acetyl-CoA synthetase-like protein [Gigaspora margarita]|uniref:Acetyl-CoA synthetase-like protein n=1 Tax=Gigaspora margarita TaxID=4874 RepID=A0A8H4ETG4_GIGMA|nr:acetyl-CoA synthetase-like protein [Gigaspora margarita]
MLHMKRDRTGVRCKILQYNLTLCEIFDITLVKMIFKSKYPDIKIPQAGIYQYVTSNPNKIPDEKVIYVDGVTGRSYTFGEFKHETKKFAAGLQDKLEFKRGDVLAIYSPNQVDYPIVLLGTIAAGGKVTTANPIYETTKLSYQLIDSGASVLIVHPEILEDAIEASIDAKIPASRVLLFGDKEIKGYKPYRSVLINDRGIEPIYYTPEEAKSTTAYLFYSSGTTGKRKGIEITHTNAVVRLAQVNSMECNLGPHSIIMAVLPLCNVLGSRILHTILMLGATAIIHSNFNTETICESIQTFKINRIYTIPPIILNLVNDPSAQQFDLSSVDKIICAGSPLSEQLERKFYNIFKIPISQDYGLTEAGGITRFPDTMKNTVPGSVGILIPNIKAKILSDDCHELGCNEPGELWIHGPNIMKSYLNNKVATDAAIDKDGFFNTGDIVYVDEQGNYFFVDRNKEMIKGLGFHVAPSELESILLTHAAVSDAAVSGPMLNDDYMIRNMVLVNDSYIAIWAVKSRNQGICF